MPTTRRKRERWKETQKDRILENESSDLSSQQLSQRITGFTLSHIAKPIPSKGNIWPNYKKLLIDSLGKLIILTCLIDKLHISVGSS